MLAEAFAELAGRFEDLTLKIVGPVGLLPYSIVQLLLDDPVMRPVDAFYGRSLRESIVNQLIRPQASYAEALERAVPDALRPRLRMLGSVPHDRLPEIYRAAEIFVLPSICREPFGIPVLEAMASGLPVVAGRGGGIPDIVADGVSGLLVERGSVRELSRAIETYLSEPARASEMGAAARRRVCERFTWQAAADRLEEAYAELQSARLAL